MAESDTILQLGIEAAREGNREEARNLFSLLTRQEPDNLQAWLWLAGVADGPEQRRAALERVLELDPSNEMAIKGLQAMGVSPGGSQEDGAYASPESPPDQPSRAMTDEERYAAELDSAFDDYDALPRATPQPRSDADQTMEIESLTASDRTAASGRASARDRSAARRASRASDGDDDMPPRSGPSPLLWALLGLIALAVVVFLGSRIFGGDPQTAGGDGEPQAGVTTPAASTDVAGGAATTDRATAEATADAGAQGPTEPLTATQALTETTAPPVEAPAATAPPAAPAGPADVSGATPALVDVGTTLEANGWSFTFPNLCPAGCGAVYGPQIGASTAQGTYVTVLVLVANNTGTAQPLPGDFFVLRDAQGRIYEAQPAVSSAYVIRGVNADLSMEDAVPGNGVQTSIPLIFDVQPGATELTLFSRAKTDQGWRVLDQVP